ncbi:hypothetical protein [Caballeronia sordidicola]|uniref:hypothetical protein n=1 Tax=Caballeronia sordidicola TaxID=196367 RepID=UPI00094CC69B|nr:hypothetical protein [Caballeronia sordidicola]
MKKMLALSVAAALILSACGGGGDNSSAPAPVLKLSFSGAPITEAAGAVAHAAVIHAAADTPASGASATVTTLQDALTAAGVAANVTAGVIDGTTLHQIVLARNGGNSPDNSLYGTVDPTDWNIVNFQLDDMVTPWTDPTQQAAVAQFQNDLAVYTQWAYVDRKSTFVVAPIPTCDGDPANPTNTTAVGALQVAEGQAAAISISYSIGHVQASEVVGHMGDDCRTPDAYILNLRTQRIVSDIVTQWNNTMHPLCAASNNQAGCIPTPPTPMCSATVTTNCQIKQ